MRRTNEMNRLKMTYLDAVEVQVECVYRYNSRGIGGANELRMTGNVQMNGYLEVVLLLADEGVVRRREIESFVGVDSVVESGAT